MAEAKALEETYKTLLKERDLRDDAIIKKLQEEKLILETENGRALERISGLEEEIDQMKEVYDVMNHGLEDVFKGMNKLQSISRKGIAGKRHAKQRLK